MSSNLSNAQILNNLLEGRNLDDLTSRSLMQRWLNDEISDVQTGAFLSALRSKGCTGVELSSMAEELLNVCDLPVARPNIYMVDTCGTGGDGANTFNISSLESERETTSLSLDIFSWLKSEIFISENRNSPLSTNTNLFSP